MTFFTVASSSIGYNLISNLLQEGLLDHRDKLRINAIKDKITAFNRKYDNDEIDTRTFDIFLNSTGLEKKIFDFIFNNVALEHIETNEFINQISMQAIEFINSSNILNGKSQFYNEEIVFNYFNELFDELYIIRNSFLSFKDRVMLSIFTDKLENTTKYNTGDIISYNDIFSLSNKKRIIDLIINNSREVYEREIENTDNVIYSSIVINDELFADIDISYIESKSYITERRLINENTSPLVKCLEIMDDSRERYLSGVSVSDNENNPKDPYIFQAEGITITAVGGMGKTISLVHLWKYILEKYNRAVVYIQLSRVNEKSDIDNFLNEAILDIAFQNSFLSTYSRHAQLEILEQILKDKVSSKQRIVLLLDGFNEIHPSKRFGIKAQIEHLFSLSGVLIILTTRPDLEFELPITKIAKCKILPLKEYRIDSLLNKYNSSCLNPILRNLLSNVLMITLFIRICEWTNIGGQNTLSLLSINSESELIENFIEALLIKNYYERKQHTDQLVMTFSMKYLIPYIGYQMIKREEYKIHDRYQLKLMIEEFQSFALEGEDPFYEMKIQHLLLEYLHEWKMMFEIKFSDNISNEIINKSLLIQPAEDGGYRFWHQNFRDFMASKFIFNELNRTLTNGRISPLLIFEWNANLLRYLQELIVSSNQSISNYVNSLLETLSNSAQNESIFIANLFRLALVNNEVLANLKVKNLDLRQLSLHGTVLKSNVIQNCKINWNIFEPNHNNSVYIIPQNTRSRVIKTNRCNRILYSQNRDRIYLLVSFGIYKIDNIWLDDFVGKRLITTDIGNLIYCQTNNEEDRFLITTNGSLIVSSTKENENCKIVQNQHYFTYDNRDYTNDILKAIFTQNDSEIVLQRENKKLEIVYIDNNYDKGFVDMDVYRQKIESCISLDNRWFARVQGDELCITDSICKISKLFFLDSFEECLLPVKFDVDCETLLLVDKVNQNYILLDLINGELKDNIKFYEQQGISIVEYSVCGKYLVFVHGDSSIRIYSINEKKTIYDYLYQSFSVVGVALSNGAKRLVVLDSNSRISVICIFTHKIIFSGEVQDISFIDTSLFDCDFTSAGTDKIKNHLMLHGADLS